LVIQKFSIHLSNKQKQNKEVMKITAAQIEKGMKIKVSKINDRTDFLTNAINGVVGYGTHSEEEKANMQKRLSENKVLFVSNGSVKKDSPILNVLGVQFSNSNSAYHNGKLCVNNQIWLVTDKGYVEISTKQKVELV
jgi:hypothetical protein